MPRAGDRARPQPGARSCATSPSRTDLPADLPLADADYSSLEQVVTNLLENAVRHAPRRVDVWIAAAREADTCDRGVATKVAGVAAEDQDVIFEPFRRGEDSTSSGVGLAICRAIVEAHGGTIAVRPRERRRRRASPSPLPVHDERERHDHDPRDRGQQRHRPRPARRAHRARLRVFLAQSGQQGARRPTTTTRRGDPRPRPRPTWTASTCAGASADGRTCRSSCSRPTTPSAARSRPSTTAPTTT